MAETTETVPVEQEKSSWRRYKWLLYGGIALIVGLIAGWAIIQVVTPYTFHGTVLQSPQRVYNFALTGPGGGRVNLNGFRGKAVLLYFGYTFCPDVCPATMVELAQAVDILGKDADKVQVMMISIDPERDTPDRLEEYVAHFDPSFIGLTGTESQVAEVAATYGIFYEKHEGTAATGYLVDHTASVVVVDPEGFLRLIYPFGTPGADIAEDLRHIID